MRREAGLRGGVVALIIKIFPIDNTKVKKVETEHRHHLACPDQTAFFLGVTMASKTPLKTTFDADRVIRPIFTGGSVAIDNSARILATTLGEDAVLTDPSNGRHLGQIEGVSVKTQHIFNVIEY